jgi:ribosome-interacting GTPase 1
MLKTFRINNADIVIRDNINDDQLIDIIEANKLYIPSIVILNKIDMVSKEKLEQLKKKIKPDLCISAKDNDHTDDLKELIFNKLDLIRIYLKEPNKKADMKVPLIVERKSRIRDVCNKMHKDFVKRFKFARVWGPSARFGGQKLMLKHVMKDEDILELHIF